jgi:hypothetical protein
MNNYLKLFSGLFIVGFIVFFFALSFEKFLTEENVRLNITKIEKKFSESGEEYSIIHTRGEIFENKNNYFHNKSNAKSLAAKLRVGENYHVKVVGFNFNTKIPLFMEHRNIIKIVNSKTIIIN